MGTTLDIMAIMRRLPHRYPFLLIDRIITIVPGESIVALKNVTMNEPHFTGHFPGNPVMPGVLQVEAMAQVGGIFALTGALALAGIWVTTRIVPPEPRGGDDPARQVQPGALGKVLRNADQLRLNFGIFSLHVVQIAIFVVVPVALVRYGGIALSDHWKVYLPVVIGSFVLMAPLLLHAERRGVFVHGADEAPSQRLDRRAALGRALDDLVVDVGDIAHVGDAQAARAQPALHHVENHEHAGVAEVAVVVHRHAADVHAHFARANRHEVLLGPRERVVDPEHPGVGRGRGAALL